MSELKQTVVKKDQNETATPAPAPAPTTSRNAVPKGHIKVTESIRKDYIEEQQNVQTNENTETIFQDISSSNLHEVSLAPSFAKNIKKNQIEILFDILAETDPHGSETYFANVTRLPDSLTDRFLYPVNTEMPLGNFQFTARDFVSFVPSLQNLNGNSGGRFTVRVLDSAGKQLYYERTVQFHTSSIEVAFTVTVPNPAPKDIAPAPGAPPDNTQGFAAVLQQMEQSRREDNNRMMELIREIAKPKEEGDFEKAIKQKMIDKLLDSEKPQGYNVDQTVSNILGTATVMEALGAGFSKMFNRDPAPPPERRVIDDIKELADTPLGAAIGQQIGNIGASLLTPRGVVKNVVPNNLDTDYDEETETEEETEYIPPETNLEMQEMITTIIKELESSNPIDNDNAVIIDLKERFPNYIGMLVGMCKGMDFDTTLNMLVNTCQMQIHPNPFWEFLDMSATESRNQFVWNARGEQLIIRLKEFYDYVRSN